MDDLIVLLKVLDLLHDLFENFGAVLWRIAVFYKADLDLQLQLIADVLIVQPVSKRRFGVDNLFDLLRQSLALVVDDSTPSTSLSVPYPPSCVSALHQGYNKLQHIAINFLFSFRQKSALCSCTSDNSYNRRTRHTVPGGEPEIHRIVGILFALSEL